MTNTDLIAAASHGSGPEAHNRVPRVLVVEDEPNIRELVCLHLGLEGYACEGLGDGREALDVLTRDGADHFDLLVLDLMLPSIDGLSLTKEVRMGQANRDVPILMLTARRDESERVLGLESGADDYLTKPFGVRELVARARALLRRPRQTAVPPARPVSPDEAAPGSPVVRVHDIEVDPARRRVRIGEQEVALTDQEFRLLHWLTTHPGIVFGRETLLATIWRGDTFVTERSVDTLVKRLRRRIEPDPANPRYLLTVWGVGYKLADR